MRPELRRCSDRASWLRAALEVLREGIEAGRALGGARLCLAGGGTPRPAYEALAAGSDPRIPLLLVPGDERLVPRDSPERNGAMLEAAFSAARRGERAWSPAPRLLLWPEGGPAEEARVLAGYAAALEELRRPSRGLFDLVLLGLGADGHCAGLFPGADYDWSLSGPLVVPGRAPSPPLARASLGPAALASAKRLVFLASGRAKRPIVEGLRDGGLDWPSARVIELYHRRAAASPEGGGPEPALILYCDED